jgi:formylglycine-generating enzyme required for sulfatase activity
MKRQFQIVLWLLSFVLFSQFGCQPAPPAKKLTNSIGMKLTYIPPGSFTMGAQPGEPGAKPAEKQHKVTLSKGCYLRIFEVTQDQYLRVMGSHWPVLLDHQFSDVPHTRSNKKSICDIEAPWSNDHCSDALARFFMRLP